MKTAILALWLVAGGVFAAQPEIDVPRLVQAIGRAENSKAHPYGVMIPCRDPRQVCENTVRHALRDWNGSGEFIVFLAKRYAPIGVKNDPHSLNRNWIKNVTYFYTHNSNQERN